MQGTEENNVVQVLWTGGFDSTFRVVQLSRLPVRIQPYYVSGSRDSEAEELRAVSDITGLLLRHPGTKATFLPLRIVGQADIPSSRDVTAAYERVLSADFIGSQYDWLARFAAAHPGIELSIHQDDRAIVVINKHGRLRKIHDELVGDVFAVDTGRSSPDVVTLWGRMRLPLAEFTKVEMQKFYEEQGYADVMLKTWFCFSPIGGKPCGCCNPCRYAMQEGMAWRIPLVSRLRYRLHEMRRAMKAFRRAVKARLPWREPAR